MKKDKNKWVKSLTALVIGGLMTMALTNTALARQMSLEESVTEAINNNHSIKQEAAAVEQAKAALGEAHGNEGVSITWSGTAEKVGGDYYNSQNIDEVYNNEITANLPLYTGGKLENNIKSAKLALEISELNLADKKQTIGLQAIQYYYEILNYTNVVSVQKEVVKQYAEHEKVAEAKYNAGVVAKTDYLRSQVDLANAKQSLVTDENNLQVAITTFNKLIGQDILTDVTPINDYLFSEQHDKTMQECMDIAIQNRPDGIAAQKTVLKAERQVAVAKAGFLPQVSLFAEKNINGSKMFDKDQTDQSMVGVKANLNIFDSAVTHSQVKQQEALLKQYQEAYAAQKDQILLDVRQAYLTMEAARKNIETTKVAVSQADEDNRIAQVRYKAGVGTNSEILDAISDYYTAQMNYNSALYNYTVSLASLNKAMGVSSQDLINKTQKIGTVASFNTSLPFDEQ